jgi:hypothetical protein
MRRQKHPHIYVYIARMDSVDLGAWKEGPANIILNKYHHWLVETDATIL